MLADDRAVALDGHASGLPSATQVSGLARSVNFFNADERKELKETPDALSDGQLRRSSNFNVLEEVPVAKRQAAKDQIQAVRCPRGHVMEARVVREMLRGLEALRSFMRCSLCEQLITTEDARYSCGACNLCYCTTCSARMVAAPIDPTNVARPLPALARSQEARTAKGSPRNIMPGDILLCGPDPWGIHHLVLVRGPMALDREAAEILGHSSNVELWSCPTIESTRGRVGRDFTWFPAHSLYSRDPVTGHAALVGVREPNTLHFEQFETPVPVKLLMHPLRPGYGGPSFDEQAFEQAVQLSAITSQHWGLSTALRAITSLQESLDPDDYPTIDSRRRLLEELTTRWTSRPICSTVVIMVWQYYFKIASGGGGPASEDTTAQRILRWIPLLADKTMPSVLLKVLTTRGWVLRGNLDA